MDIIITEKSLRGFLKTEAKIEKIIELLSSSGPTVDRFHKSKGDAILEIEIITNRIDSASAFGVAREANAILNQNKIKSSLTNSPYLHKIKPHETKTQKLNFKISDSKLVKRFTAISISDVNVKSSPDSVRKLLEDSGQRPINNLVDATNEATLLYGIPSHVFDKDKLSLQNLTIREAKKGETLYTLDDTKIKLQEGDIIIEDGSGKIVDLCGVMGGREAVVDEHTKNIILIVPVYNPLKIRKTSLTHQKRTLAAQIYEKGPDAEICLPILNFISQNITKRAGGKESSKIFDNCPAPFKSKTVSLDLLWLNNFAGTKISKQEVLSILKNLGFENSKIAGEILNTSVPSFRHDDISTREDLAEEIIRVYGYSHIPSSLPPLNKTPKPSSAIFALEQKIKTILSTKGFNEVYNSSLISKSLIESSNLLEGEHLKLKNCLSEDLEYLRTTLVPSSLQNHANNKGKLGQPLNFFEVANIYIQNSNNSLPNEISTLLISTDNELLYLKQILEILFSLLNYNNYDFIQPGQSSLGFINSQNSADIIINNQRVGYVGQIKPLVTKKFNVLNSVSVAEINLSTLNNTSPFLQFTPISEYPYLKNDITVTSTKLIGEIIKDLKSASKNIKDVTFKGSYDHKHTFEVTIGSNNKNLTQADAEIIRKKIFESF